jgi:hypothetical protein
MNIVREVTHFPVVTARRTSNAAFPEGFCLSVNTNFADSWQFRCYTSGDESRLIHGMNSVAKDSALELAKRLCEPLPSNFTTRRDVLTREERPKLEALGVELPPLNERAMFFDQQILGR